MSQPCLRNMSCKCPLCMGEDVSALLAITKNITSNITYTEPGDEDAAPPPTTKSGFMANSPPTKPAAAPAPRQSLKARLSAKPATAPPVEKLPPLDFQDVDMGSSADNGPSSSSSNAGVEEQHQQAPLPPPISSGGEAPPEFAADDGAASARPASSNDGPLQMEQIEAKVIDKNWKVRKEVYDDLKAAFESGRAIEGGNVTELFGKFVDDSNAAAMECGLAAVLAYAVQASPQQWNNAIIGRVLPKVVDKGFSGRPGTVKLAEELVLEFVHLGSAEDTVAALLEGTKNKKPKVPPLCVNSILECFKAFGPRVVPVVAVKKELKSLCESTVNNVRPTALKLIGELYRWTGPTLVQDIVASLRPAQQTEYETMIKEITPGQAAPTRFLKGKEPKPASAATAKVGGKGGAAAGAAAGKSADGGAFDPREFAETVNLLDRLPKTEFKAKMALPKWSEKVEALKIILDTVGSVPKLANGDYGDLVQTLKLCTQDANVNIVAKSIEVLGVLADGLRRNFAQYARIMVPVLLRKLSDKKSNVLAATHQALDMFQQHALPIDNMMDELKITIEGATNKMPASRAQGVVFVERCISNQTVNVADAALMKTFGEMFANCIEDPDPALRKAGVDAMVTLVKSSPQAPRFVKNTLEVLEKRQARSYKVIEAAMGGAGAASAPKQQASSVPKPSTASANSVPKDASKTPSAAPPPARANSLKKLPSSSSSTAAKPSKPAPGKAAAAVSSSDTITMSPQEAEIQLEGLDLDGWSTSIVPNLQSAKWTDRKAAFEALEEAFKLVSSDIPTANLDAVVVFVASQSKNFKESNVQVLKSAFQSVATIAGLCDAMGGGVVSFVVPPAVDKMGDRKVSDTVRPMLLAFGELVGPAAVLGAIFDHMTAVKLPLAQVECLEVASECVRDFGVAACNPRAIIEYAKSPYGLESSNPKSRAAAVALFGSLYAQLGDAMRPLLNLDGWKAALRDAVEAEFKRVGFTPHAAASATRVVKGGGGGAGTAATGGGGGSLFGRVDISAKITKELLADMQNEDDKVAWKKRLDAMEQTQRICEEAGLSIELTKAVMELMKSLKARLGDSNANLKTKAVQVIGVVATSVGPAVAKLAKLVGNNLVVGVSDNKKAMQQACLEALHKWVVHNDVASGSCFESLLPFVAEALKNPVGRADLLGWTVAMTQSITVKLDLRPLVENTIDALSDKSTDAREKAQLLLVDVFKSVGKDAVQAGCRDILPAKMRTLKPMIDRASAAAFGSAAGSGDEDKPAAKSTASLSRSTSTVGGTRTPAPAPSPKAMTSIPRSSSTASTASSVASAAPPTSSLLISSDKLTRLERSRKNKWIFDAADPAELLARKGQLEAEWSGLVHSSLRAKLFAVSYEKGMMQAIDDLSACVSSQPDEVFQSLDLILKWSTLRIVDNNVQALVKMLDLLVKLFQMLVDFGWELDDVEAAIFLPYLCQESGQQKPRFRMRFRDVLRLVVHVYPSTKLTPYLVECLTNSKNSKSRSECLDLVEFIAETKGQAAVGRKTLRDIAKYVDSSEKEIRESAIAAVVKMYTLMGDASTDRFFTLCNISSQKSMDLVLQKIKYLPPPAATTSTDAQQRSTPKPTMPTPVSYQRYASASLDEPAREPPLATHDHAMHAKTMTSRLERPVTPLKYQTSTPSSSSHPPGYAQPPPTTPSLLQRPITPVKYQSGHADAPRHAPSTPTTTYRGDFSSTPLAATTTRTDMRAILFQPLERLLVSQRELTVNLDAFAAGKDALKSLYMLASTGDDVFLQENVNEVLLRVCQVLHAAFGKPHMELNVVSLCVATIANIFKHPTYTSRIERIAIERLLLEACMGFLDPRLDDVEATLSNRIMVALNKLIMTTAYALRIGEVWLAMLNVLERVVNGKVDEYKIHDKLNKVTDKPTLARLVAKLLVKTTRRELTLPAPFLSVDVGAALHTKHRFFTTCPDSTDADDDVVWAKNAMKTSLKHAADFWGPSDDRRPEFQRALNDLPISSPIHRMLMQIMPSVFTVPSPDMVARGLNNAVQLFSTTTDPATKLQASMTMVEVKMNSAAAAIEIDASKKEELRQTVDKLDMAAYNRTGASATDSAIKSALTRTNIFKDRSLEFSSSTSSGSATPGATAASGDQPPKSMALMDLKQRLARIQMH